MLENFCDTYIKKKDPIDKMLRLKLDKNQVELKSIIKARTTEVAYRNISP